MNEIFKLETLFTPQQFVLCDYPRVPTAAFNPAAFNLPGTDEIVIFPRLIFDDQFYVSSIGVCEPISLAELSSVKTLTTRLLATPTDTTDFKGLEDPRITSDGKKMLHVALDERNVSRTVLSTLTAGDLYNFRTLRLSEEDTPSGRDAAIINDKYLVFRPEMEDLISYSVPYSQDGIIDFKNAIEVLSPLKSELKRGFSTNAVKISSNEHLIMYHSVLQQNLEYTNGFAVFNEIGEILGISDPFFRLPHNFLRYGNRPQTLFGCGLILHNDILYSVNGVGDWALGLFTASLEDVLKQIK